MNIETESAISITLQKDEVMTILLDHIKRIAGGVVKKDMQLVDTEGEFNNITFFWSQVRNKTI